MSTTNHEHTGDDTEGAYWVDADWTPPEGRDSETLTCFTREQLLARDAAVRADAVDEAADQCPYRFDGDVKRWLRDRADELRAAVAPHTDTEEES